MRSLVFQAVLFGGLTAWAAWSNPWIVPAFACLTGSRLLMLAVETGRIPATNVPAVLLIQLGLAYAGGAYLLAAWVGLPNRARFWVVFGAVLAIFAPVLALGRRLFR